MDPDRAPHRRRRRQRLPGRRAGPGAARSTARSASPRASPTAIERERSHASRFTGTARLAELVRDCDPGRHPAHRRPPGQAHVPGAADRGQRRARRARRALPAAVDALAVGGRIAVITLPLAGGPDRQADPRRGRHRPHPAGLPVPAAPSTRPALRLLTRGRRGTRRTTRSRPTRGPAPRGPRRRAHPGGGVTPRHRARPRAGRTTPPRPHRDPARRRTTATRTPATPTTAPRAGDAGTTPPRVRAARGRCPVRPELRLVPATGPRRRARPRGGSRRPRAVRAAGPRPARRRPRSGCWCSTPPSRSSALNATALQQGNAAALAGGAAPAAAGDRRAGTPAAGGRRRGHAPGMVPGGRRPSSCSPDGQLDPARHAPAGPGRRRAADPPAAAVRRSPPRRGPPPRRAPDPGAAR